MNNASEVCVYLGLDGFIDRCPAPVAVKLVLTDELKLSVARAAIALGALGATTVTFASIPMELVFAGEAARCGSMRLAVNAENVFCVQIEARDGNDYTESVWTSLAEIEAATLSGGACVYLPSTHYDAEEFEARVHACTELVCA
jgi:hypothetical protein